MRLVTLSKLTIHTPQGDQIKFFTDDFDAIAYKKTSNIQHPTSLLTCHALHSVEAYCLVEQIKGYDSNAGLKSKNAIYTVKVNDKHIELGNITTTLSTDTTCVYLSENNQLYHLINQITVEKALDALQHIKSDYNQAISASQLQPQQSTLHQFWTQPLKKAGMWPVGTQQPAATPHNDPMDVDIEKDRGYDYWGVSNGK